MIAVILIVLLTIAGFMILVMTGDLFWPMICVVLAVAIYMFQASRKP